MLLRGCVLLTVLFLLTPIVYLTRTLFLASKEAWQIDERLFELTFNSISCALITSLIALLIAIPLAFLFCHYHFKFKKILFIIFCLPIIIPSYILAYSYQALANPLGIEVTGFWGTCFVLALSNYPLAFLFISNSLRQYDYQLDEISYTLGYNKWSTFCKITFWQILPALLSSGVIISLYALSDFGTPSLMNFPTFTREVKIYYDLGQLDKANILTVFLIFIAFIFIFISEKFRREQERYSQNSSKSYFYQTHKLTGIKQIVFIACSILLSSLIFLPLKQIMIWFFQGIASKEASFWQYNKEIINSISLSFSVALFTLLFAFPCTYFHFLHRHSKLNKSVAIINFFGNAIPGISLAFCMIFLFSSTSLYQTFFIIVFTLTLRFFAQAYNPLKHALEEIHPSHYESSKLLGKNNWQSFYLVILPQIKNSLFMSMSIVFVFVFKELAITLLMAPAGFNTLPQHIWASMDEGEFSQIGIPIFCVILISSFLLIHLYRAQKFNNKKI